MPVARNGAQRSVIIDSSATEPGLLTHEGEEAKKSKRSLHRSASSALKAAQAGRHLLAAAFAHNSSHKRGATPKHVKERAADPQCEPTERPTGRIEVDFPCAEAAWDERLRDLMRTLQGGSLYIAGRQRLRHLQVNAGVPGDVSHEAAQLGFKDLMKVISGELAEQGVSLSAACESRVMLHTRPTGNGNRLKRSTTDEFKMPTRVVSDDSIESFVTQRRKTTGVQLPEAALEEPIHDGALQEVARQVAAHISVSPGMQAAEQTGMPPGMWQPMYIVCIGCAQIRVVTFAFIGGPATGDRPDCKRTPFVLRLTTSDLMHAASASMSGSGPPTTSAAWYTVEPTASNAELILDHVTDLEEELFRAIQTGDWGLLSGATMQVCRLTNAQSLSQSSSVREYRKAEAAPAPFAGVM